MADAELRWLERQIEGGHEAQHSKLLVAQVRAGRVSRTQLRLTARLGGPMAPLARELLGLRAPSTVRDLRRFALLLKRLGPAAVARAFDTCLLRTAPLLAGTEFEPLAREALDALAVVRAGAVFAGSMERPPPAPVPEVEPPAGRHGRAPGRPGRVARPGLVGH